MPPKELRWHIKIEPSVRPSVTNRVSAISQTTETNLMKLHRKIKHNEKVQELGSYAQGQGRNQVKGQIVPKIVLLINY